MIATPSFPAPAGASDAMDVGVGGPRHVVVDDVREMADVQSARGDVGRGEQLRRAVAKAAHHAIALFLGMSAVQRLDAVAAGAEHFGQMIDFGAGAAEDDRRRGALHVEDAAERFGLVLLLHDVGDLANLGFRAARRHVAGDGDARRILEVRLGDRRDARRDGGREERRLPFFR